MLHNYMTMTDIATRMLRRGILLGEYPPETRLIPGKLAETTDIGLAGIRDALRELTGSGLVVSVANKGYFVTFAPSEEEIKEIFQMRFHVEVKAAIAGAARISTADLARMEELHEEMSGNAIRIPKGFFLPNREFHLILYRASGWRTLCNIIEQLLDRILVFQSTRKGRQTDYAENILQHRQIIDAVKTGDMKTLGDTLLKNLKLGLAGNLGKEK